MKGEAIRRLKDLLQVEREQWQKEKEKEPEKAYPLFFEVSVL
jgi:hypothetical protein